MVSYMYKNTARSVKYMWSFRINKFEATYSVSKYCFFFAQYEFSVIFDTSHLSGQEEMLTFLVTAQR